MTRQELIEDFQHFLDTHRKEVEAHLSEPQLEWFEDEGKMIDNRVAIVSNYATEALQKTLDVYAENDYRLVNAMLAKNKYSIDVMYLFFTKESAVVESEETE